MQNIHDLNSLPIVITVPGDYITRDGKCVTISEIRGPSTFAAKGSEWVMLRGNLTPKFSIWHINGRHLPLKECVRDIVGPWIVS